LEFEKIKIWKSKNRKFCKVKCWILDFNETSWDDYKCY